ncbi:DNA polymerase III subunit delta' [Mycolicibacterium arabiense]|uniref:DNA polymerase III subunit delta n=1 Tax=Mycolicibacterium arabiense TaxID=1286181 RepID=A0A7I7RUB7_9MYCO|nr:heme-binding protein [Mycolicibacterium arabiense]MCV7375990.1 heme-binding protein [Mycolicibacterium arabiense]BBY47345.1 DNA polymerase III subunit delta' [Mycolicibacterium arabiense]
MTLDLDAANRIIAGAHAEARRRAVLVSAAVVDAGGNLVAFGRMDGAEIAGPVLAVDKAYTAIANRIATSELATLAAPGGELFGLHANGGGRFVIFGGGVPVWIDGVVVGGVGVSGASTADDEACALAGLDTLGPGHAK